MAGVVKINIYICHFTPHNHVERMDPLPPCANASYGLLGPAIICALGFFLKKYQVQIIDTFHISSHTIRTIRSVRIWQFTFLGTRDQTRE